MLPDDMKDWKAPSDAMSFAGFALGTALIYGAAAWCYGLSVIAILAALHLAVLGMIAECGK